MQVNCSEAAAADFRGALVRQGGGALYTATGQCDGSAFWLSFKPFADGAFTIVATLRDIPIEGSGRVSLLVVPGPLLKSKE